MRDPSDLRAVPLYTHVDRIARGLAARGIGPNDAIPPAELFALDQWHYHGTDAIRDAGAFLGLGPASRVLDIGSGIGGPARFLAHTTGCHVTALELQPELHRVGLDLTRRSGLADRVTHLCGDALEQPLSQIQFGHSFLATSKHPAKRRSSEAVREKFGHAGKLHENRLTAVEVADLREPCLHAVMRHDVFCASRQRDYFPDRLSQLRPPGRDP